MITQHTRVTRRYLFQQSEQWPNMTSQLFLLGVQIKEDIKIPSLYAPKIIVLSIYKTEVDKAKRI